MATKNELAIKVLQKLGVAEAGETPSTDDTGIVEDKYDSRYKVLAAKDLVSWGSGDDIPTEAVEPVTSIVANDCLSEFIIPQDKQGIIARDANQGLIDLLTLEYVDYVPEEPENYYF